MDKVKRKWWFATPILVLTVGCTFGLWRALGLGDPVAPLSLPRLVAFLIFLDAFRRLFSWVLWWTLVWCAPTLVGERRLNASGRQA